MSSSLRSTFLFKRNKSHEIKAAGIFFIKKNSSGNSLLLTQEVLKEKNKKIFSDFGGKVDDDDKYPIDTITREFLEESNGSLFRMYNGKRKYLKHSELKELINENLKKKIYIQKSKYLLFFVELPDTVFISFRKAGLSEDHDRIKRKVKWISVNYYLKKHFSHGVHPRLWNIDLISYLKTLDRNNKFLFKE